MSAARICLGFTIALVSASVVLPASAASRRLAQPEIVTRASAAITPTDFSASRRRAGRVRHATRVHVYRRGDYSFFEPYAPPVPLFFPFGYHQGYF